MIKLAVAIVSCLLAAGTAVPLSLAQEAGPAPSHCPARMWVDDRQHLEETLGSAEVLGVEDVGMGVTDPKRVTLQSGELTFAGAFKPIKRGRQRGYWESFEAEVAAYRLDKKLGLNMVPPTVIRRIGSNRGSLQLWIEDCRLYSEVKEQRPPQPLEWANQLAAMKMFDQLIRNQDRNARNFLVDEGFHVVLIDHSRAFLSSDGIDYKPTSMPKRFPRQPVERLRQLDRAALEPLLGDLLDGSQLKGLDSRRRKLLDHIDSMAREKGEAAVYFSFSSSED